MSLEAVDWGLATPDDRAQLLGESFRNLQVVECSLTPEGFMRTGILIDGKRVLLIGDPERCLLQYHDQKQAQLSQDAPKLN